MNVSQARRLYLLAETGINRLDTALFAAEEADQIGLDPIVERANANRQLGAASDALIALANLDVSASTLRDQVLEAVSTAKANPFSTLSIPPEEPDDHETDIYHHPVVLRELLSRIAAIYAVDPDQLAQTTDAALGRLLTICRNSGAAIQTMISNRLIDIPTGEHQVKHLLFAIARASYPDAIPDGGTSFKTSLRAHKPDFAIPRLQCCVETKIARDPGGLSSAIDGVIADQSNYGSAEYRVFVAVIYASDDTLTQDLLDQEVRQRAAKGGEPNFEWHWILVQGNLKPPRPRSLSSKK